MPWKERTIMTERLKFVQTAQQEGANKRALCRAYGISSRTGYKWLNRYKKEGEPGLADRSRRPHNNPNQTAKEMETKVLGVRKAHPAWGGRKIRAYLQRQGVEDVPAASTITAILHRNQCIDPEESKKRTALQRFEMEQPNQIWQMDFKGPFMTEKSKCCPLTVLDDHSRYLVGLTACSDQKIGGVRAALTETFRQYGLPDAFLVDNGPPWGGSRRRAHNFTDLSIWILRLGIRMIYISPRHPQTIGKDERLHRTLKAEVIKQHDFENLAVCQNIFDAWRELYNHDRPHQALDMDVPASRYRSSQNEFPETLPPIEYDAGAIVHTVMENGCIALQDQQLIWIGKIFSGYPVALFPDPEKDGVFKIYFCRQKIKSIEL